MCVTTLAVSSNPEPKSRHGLTETRAIYLVFRPSECPCQQTRSWQPSLPSEPRTSATVCFRVRVPFSPLPCEASRSHVCSSTLRVHFQEIGAPKTGVRSIHGSIRGMRAAEAETRAVSPKPKVAASAARIPTALELQRRKRVTQVSATQKKALRGRHSAGDHVFLPDRNHKAAVYAAKP